MSISRYESMSKHLDSSRTLVRSLPSHVTLTDSPLDWIFKYKVRMGCWCGLASGIVIGRLINEWRSTWCILRARTAKTRSCYQGGRKSQPSILVSVAPQNVWPTQKKLRVWMVWNEGMWGRALVLGRAYIMKNLLTTTTIAARGKVNFSWPKWHRLSDRLICVFSLCVLLESDVASFFYLYTNQAINISQECRPYIT